LKRPLLVWKSGRGKVLKYCSLEFLGLSANCHKASRTQRVIVASLVQEIFPIHRLGLLMGKEIIDTERRVKKWRRN